MTYSIIRQRGKRSRVFEVSCSSLSEAKRIFCDKCNAQQPLEVLQLFDEDTGILIASVEFFPADFSADKLFQVPARQLININHSYWRES